ncbi:hypothetical protein AND4_02348 [Vibrio sp. AND4]|nr:hypothetical protein AND4_02348 [Vibrio sp. AND4]
MVDLVQVAKLFIFQIPNLEFISFLEQGFGIAASTDTNASVLKRPIIALAKVMDLIKRCA